MRITLGNGSLAQYPPGGGHWSMFLQWPLGILSLGHKLFWIELLQKSADRDRDLRLIREFFARIARYGLAEHCALLLVPDKDVQDLDRAEPFGRTRTEIAQAIRDTDLLWNHACAIREPLLSNFRRPVLIDTDPGHLQVSALSWDLGIKSHHAFLTVGSKIHHPDCAVPTLGLSWRSFLPPVHLPMWLREPDPGAEAPFSSITQWTWEELPFGGRTLSASKRAAYLAYAELPRHAGRSFELAANIGAEDPAQDRQTLRSGGWTLTEPHDVVATPELYREFIRRSRAELLCAKPIYRELNTGWFSDRSSCYLATGRPVLAEDTGFAAAIPAGHGLL
ncbi:MAG TPA: hypothetical protein VEJ86_09125, partial [Candidatus Binataceae bacterium]|nr:hypothetical protein [Candidatus Binataceae bacterium]